MRNVPDIDVQAAGEHEGRLSFLVTVDEAGDTSTHLVTLARSDLERWGTNAETPEAFVRRCFQFLLEREPKESILSRFDVSDIRRYFPRFEEEIRRGEH
jgi:hypothetical protein